MTAGYDCRWFGTVAGPTFEDLMFDDSLNDLQRIAQYCTSRIALQRLVHVKMLTNVAQEYPFQVPFWAGALSDGAVGHRAQRFFSGPAWVCIVDVVIWRRVRWSHLLAHDAYHTGFADLVFSVFRGRASRSSRFHY